MLLYTAGVKKHFRQYGGSPYNSIPLLPEILIQYKTARVILFRGQGTKKRKYIL